MLAGALVLGMLGCGPRPPERPNLVLITLDTTRADHLGSWGYDRDTSARFDALAKESILFENLLVPMATTLPSHTTLLTGTEPLEHGIVANIKHGGHQFQASPSLQTFTQMLKAEGYATGAVLSATPLIAGSGIEAGFDLYDCPDKGSREAKITSARAEKWLSTAPEPFFLWVHYYDAHGPFNPPKRHAKVFMRDGKVHDWLAARQIGETATRPTGQVLDSVDATNLYDGEIRYQDRQMERVFDKLRERELWDSTVVVVAGDHGEGLGQHGMAGHGGVWREQVHAPLLIRSPWAPPARVKRAIGMADVLPTLLGLVSFPGADRLRAQASGVDALNSPERPLYHHSSDRQLQFGRVQDALTVDDWRYVRDEAGKDHLFYRPTDPYELGELSVVLPVHATLMHLWLMGEWTRLDERGKALGRGVSEPFDADQVEQLRQLGYVDDAAPEDPTEEGSEDGEDPAENEVP